VVVQAVCPQGLRTRMFEEAGAQQHLLAHDRALTPEKVADAVREALDNDRFLVLPHPQVAGTSPSVPPTPTAGWRARKRRVEGPALCRVVTPSWDRELADHTGRSSC